MAATTAVVAGAAASAYAANKASKAQSSAAKDAAAQQGDAAAAMREDLAPYRDLGEQAINPLWAAMGYKLAPDAKAVSAAQAKLDTLIKQVAENPQWNQAKAQEKIAAYRSELEAAQNNLIPSVDPNSALQKKFAFDAKDLANTPGYQFALGQGLKSTGNMLASQGLGLSGAQAKGLSRYATGLADQTYGEQYNRALSSYNTNYQVAANNVNNLQNLLNVGQNSAAQTGQAQITAANNAGNYLTQAGNAQAAGVTGVANALNNGANNYLLYNALYK
jgi:hypothetical protein